MSVRRLFCLAFLFLTVPAAGLLSAPANPGVVKIRIDGIIHPIAAEYIGRALDSAKSGGDQAVLIELDTPGGLFDSTRDIANEILASPIPVIVYVSPAGSRAASAGFFILESADIAAMAPGTNTGAAHPVTLGAEKIDEIMKNKIENDAAAMMRSIAAKRGRNVAVAESAVRASKSFTDQEALQQRLIDVIAPSEGALFRYLDGRKVRRFDGRETTLHLRNAPVRTIEMTTKQKVLSFIMDPNIAFILLSLGMLAIWAEFNHPGAILPGVVGLISILLAAFALNILPTRFAALALILLAFILFILEAKFTSHGVLGTGGVIAMFLGALLLIDSPVPEMRVNWMIALAVSIPFGLITIFLVSLVIQARAVKVETGPQGMVGEIGVARTPLTPAGKVFVHGEIWNAVSSRDVETGASVQVRKVDGLTVEVEPL